MHLNSQLIQTGNSVLYARKGQQNPLNSKRKDIGQGYQSFAENLVKFDELGELPKTLQLDRMDEGEGIKAAMVSNKAKWHRSASLQ